MGTNYYLLELDRDFPYRNERDRIHIGKSSSGWVFTLRIYPDRDINTLYDWIPLLMHRNNSIVDEYGIHINLNEMLNTIMVRGRDELPSWTAAQYDINSAIPGPNNLIRHKLSHGMTHGEGTWDYCDCDFF